MSTLDETYLDALVTRLNSQLTADPPLQGAFGLIRFGKLQEDPTAYAAVGLLRCGDKEDPAWVPELIQIQGDISGALGNIGTGLMGRLLEMGGGSHWWHKYTCELLRYKLDTSDTRFDSAAESWELGWWLERQIMLAQPWTLGLAAVNGHELMQVRTVRLRPREGGGPSNYIWKITVPFQGLVHHEL